MKTEEYLEAMRVCDDTKMLRGLWFVITKGNIKVIERIRELLDDSNPAQPLLEDAIQRLENLSDAAVIHFAEVSGNESLEDQAKEFEALLDMDEEFYVH